MGRSSACVNELQRVRVFFIRKTANSLRSGRRIRTLVEGGCERDHPKVWEDYYFGAREVFLATTKNTENTVFQYRLLR